MSDFQLYIDQIADPTFQDFARHPKSSRHAFLACLAVYHAIDRASYPNEASELREQWCSESFEFLIVDMVAHHFKHVQSGHEKAPAKPGSIPLVSMVFGSAQSKKTLKAKRAELTGGGIDLHNLYFIVRDSIAFLRSKAASMLAPFSPPPL